jgi:hypothetical protein
MEKIDPRPRNCVQKSWIGRGHCMQEEKRNRTLDACMRPQKTVLQAQSSKSRSSKKQCKQHVPSNNTMCFFNLPVFVRIGLGKIFSNGRNQPAYIGVVAIDGTFQQR